MRSDHQRASGRRPRTVHEDVRTSLSAVVGVEPPHRSDGRIRPIIQDGRGHPISRWRRFHRDRAHPESAAPATDAARSAGTVSGTSRPSATATRSLTSRRTSDIGTSSASQMLLSSSHDASFDPAPPRSGTRARRGPLTTPRAGCAPGAVAHPATHRRSLDGADHPGSPSASRALIHSGNRSPNNRRTLLSLDREDSTVPCTADTRRHGSCRGSSAPSRSRNGPSSASVPAHSPRALGREIDPGPPRSPPLAPAPRPHSGRGRLPGRRRAGATGRACRRASRPQRARCRAGARPAGRVRRRRWSRGRRRRPAGLGRPSPWRATSGSTAPRCASSTWSTSSSVAFISVA